MTTSVLLICAIIAYIIIVDKNVEDYIVLLFRMCKINVQKIYWIIRLHPNNPITNLMNRMKYAKIAEELEKEFSDKVSNSN